MPHYKDGTPATVGDTVRGKGYNLKDPETGELAEITGTLLWVDPSAGQCNVQVAVVTLEELPEAGPDAAIVALSAAANGGARYVPIGKLARLKIEYGQADHFQKV